MSDLRFTRPIAAAASEPHSSHRSFFEFSGSNHSHDDVRLDFGSNLATAMVARDRGCGVVSCGGDDLRGPPFIERKARLTKLLRRADAGIRLVEHDEGDGAAVYRVACRMGLEGIA